MSGVLFPSVDAETKLFPQPTMDALAEALGGASPEEIDSAVAAYLADNPPATATVDTVTGLQEALDGKQDAGDYATSTDLLMKADIAALVNKADLVAGFIRQSQIPAQPVSAAQAAADAAVQAYAVDRAHHTGTQLASTISDFNAAADARVSLLAAAAPTTLDTIAEIDAAINNDPNFATTMTTSLAGKVPTARTVAGHPLTSDVSLVKADVGLPNVDNTADASKPVSTAQAAADTASRDRANHTGSQLASTISDATAVGKSILTAADPAAVRSLLSVPDITGASHLVIQATTPGSPDANTLYFVTA